MYGCLRKWSKILPIGIVEWYLKNQTYDDSAYLTKTTSYGKWEDPVVFIQIYDGVFICWSEKLRLKQKKRDLEREIDKINERLGNSED